MAKIKIIEWTDSGQQVTSKHFGGNAIGNPNTDDGRPTEGYKGAIKGLGIETLRYPAGQTEDIFKDGMIIDGKLPEHLRKFMNWAEKEGYTVVIVTPTKESYPGYDELQKFAKLAAKKYGDTIEAFEIGNEFWGHNGEKEYGVTANESVQAINEGLKQASYDTDIWVQMADPTGKESDFGPGTGGWITRTIEANNEIVKQLDSETREIIDGVVEHYYFNKPYISSNFDINTKMLPLDISIWKDALGLDTTVNLTEWNIKSSNVDLLGMKAASTMIAQFSFMMELQIDTAYSWPPQHNTSNDLAGSWDKEAIFGSDGIVTNTIGGATFSMMADSLKGKTYLKSEFSNAGDNVRFDLYGDSSEIVLYVSSRSDKIENLDVLIPNLGMDLELSQTRKISYDKSTSDGKFYNNQVKAWQQAESVTIMGKEYVLNEHDVRAKIKYFDSEDILSDQTMELKLKPFEVFELTFSVQGFLDLSRNIGATTIEGTLFSDRVGAGSKSELIKTFDGDDRIFAGMGSDRVFSGDGDDFVGAGSGNDFVNAGSGDDFVLGWDGNDILRGLSGSDFLDGYTGDDRIYGGSGNDTLFGRDGRDILEGRTGKDLLWGGLGKDKIFGGKGADKLHGGGGSDTLSGGLGNDIFNGGNGNDILIDDTKNGGSDKFIFKGNYGNDTILGFEPGVDKLIFAGNSSKYADLEFSKIGSGVLIKDGVSSVLLADFKLFELSDTDFDFL